MYLLLRLLSATAMLLFVTRPAAAEPTRIDVRVIARGAKFLGGYTMPVQVTLTDSGHALLKNLADKVRDCHERQLGHLTSAEQRQLIALLAAARRPHETEESDWRV